MTEEQKEQYGKNGLALFKELTELFKDVKEFAKACLEMQKYNIEYENNILKGLIKEEDQYKEEKRCEAIDFETETLVYFNTAPRKMFLHQFYVNKYKNHSMAFQNFFHDVYVYDMVQNKQIIEKIELNVTPYFIEAWWL